MFIFILCCIKFLKNFGSFCVDSEIFFFSNFVFIVCLYLYLFDVLMCRLVFLNVFRIVVFGFVFIVYCIVNLYVFGNVFVCVVCVFSVVWLYMYVGVLCVFVMLCVFLGVRNCSVFIVFVFECVLRCVCGVVVVCVCVYCFVVCVV